MKIGANLWIWEAPITIEVIERRAPALAAWGFDTIELPYEEIGAWDAARVDAILKQEGLAASVCVAMPPNRDLTTDDAVTVRRTTKYLVAAADAAARIGAPVVAGPIYSPTGRTGALSPGKRQELLDRLAGNLEPIARHADEAGVKIAIEPLNRFETSFFNTTEQLAAFLDRIDHPRLGLLLDTFHMNIEEQEMVAAIGRVGKRLFHFHACGNDRGAPRLDGRIPWSAMVNELRRIGYDGSLVIESFTGENEAVAAAAAIWRPLAPTQDAIALEGLRTLRFALGREGLPGV